MKMSAQRLAIVLDGVVHSAPVIQERISGGQAQITGNFTMDEARDLAIVLRAGAIPAPSISWKKEPSVHPWAATRSNRALSPPLIGSLLVVLFMIVYYRLSGTGCRYRAHSEYYHHSGCACGVQGHAHTARHRRHCSRDRRGG
ncbi:MAG: hypothetical protein MZV70_63950 [Desulfobacterales bacterium]|nr:hypothetical protein [Desulfobacterales bacterium]